MHQLFEYAWCIRYTKGRVMKRLDRLNKDHLTDTRSEMHQSESSNEARATATLAARLLDAYLQIDVLQAELDALKASSMWPSSPEPMTFL